jgi:lipopolysaccharide transport system ATP-binding protein
MTAAIDVKGVGKRFDIPSEKTATLFEAITNSALGRTRWEAFWALKDITFTVEKGESLGIIGGNGSGKSTLLKLISNILRPTKGTIKVNGRLTTFLELGVGFQQDLTARENIYLYGRIMGMRSREIDRKIEDIVKFSELERFLDAKLRNFSSGMHVRLAFATAIQTDPEILLVDEVLAVGDMAFQQKCFDYFHQYTQEGGTMVLVTHDLTAVTRFCDKTLLLRNGEAGDLGPTDKVIDTYVYNNQRMDAAKEKVGERWGTKKAIISDVEFLDKYGHATLQVSSGDPITIRIHYQARERLMKPVFGVAIHTEQGAHLYGTNTQLGGLQMKPLDAEGRVDINIPAVPMLYGKYYLTVALHTEDHVHHDWRNREYSFNVIRNKQDEGMLDLHGRWNV